MSTPVTNEDRKEAVKLGCLHCTTKAEYGCKDKTRAECGHISRIARALADRGADERVRVLEEVRGLVAQGLEEGKKYAYGPQCIHCLSKAQEMFKPPPSPRGQGGGA